MATNVFKAYSNLSNAKRAVKGAKLAEGTYALAKLDGGRVEVQDLSTAADAVMAPAKPVDYSVALGQPGGPQLDGAPLAPKVPRKPAAQPKESAKAKAAARKALAAQVEAQGSGLTPHQQELHRMYGTHVCPHCGIGLDNGVGEHLQEVNRSRIKHKEFQFECLGCGTEFGPPIRKRKVNGPVTQGRNQGGYKIQKNREKRNGIRRYSEGTIASQIWAMYDGLAKEAGGVDKLELPKARDTAVAKGYNRNKATIEFYIWRRFNGIRGRVDLKKAKKK